MDRTALLLFFVALAVGVFNAVIGPTGGVMAGATAALVPPPASLLLHASVSWWSSLLRCVALRTLIDRRLLGRLAAASLPVLAVCLLTSTRLTSASWRLVIAAFLVSWALSARFRDLLSHPRSAVLASFLAGAASAAIGAGGVIVMPTIRAHVESLDEAIATEAALTVLQNTVKIALLVLLVRVSVEDQLTALVLMSAGASCGLVIGRRISVELTPELRDRMLSWSLLAVAGWLITTALVSG